MSENQILRTKNENDFTSEFTSSSSIPIENVSFNNDSLDDITLSNSSNGRVVTADDPFIRVVELDEDGNNNGNDYLIENSKETFNIEKTKLKDSTYASRELYLMPNSLKGEYNPIPDLQKDFYLFNYRVQSMEFRLYNPPTSKFLFFEDLKSCKNWIAIPDAVLKQEEVFVAKFPVLHDVSKNVQSVQVEVAGRLRKFATFHYEDPTNQLIVPREYVEIEVHPELLYRFDVRAAVCLTTQGNQYAKRKSCPRFYVTYCRLSCNDNERFENHRFTLIGILTTLCASPYTIYLLWDNRWGCVLEWKNETFLKYFWCDLSCVISETECSYLKCRLHDYYRVHSFFYDHTRTIPRDYHDIGKLIYIHLCLTTSIV
jgi:hypothetical protein